MEYKVVVNDDGEFCGEFWYKAGTNTLHRLDGPAYIRSNGHKEWFKEGKLHRLDGPAIIYSDGRKEWWVDGKRLTEEEFNNRNEKEVFTKEELKNMSLDQIYKILSEK